VVRRRRGGRLTAPRPLPSASTAHFRADPLLHSVRPLERHPGLIALTTVVVAASALFASLAQSKVYVATAVVRVATASQTNAEVARLGSARVRADVARQTGVTPPVTVARGPRPGEVLVTAKSDNARGAANLANGYVAVSLDEIKADRAVASAGPAGDLRARLADVQRQFDVVNNELANARAPAVAALAARRDAVLRQQADLQAQLAQLTATPPGPVLATPARSPSSPVEPHTLRNTLVGLAVGLVFGVLVALALDYAARRRAPSVQREPKAAPPFVPAAAAAATHAPAPQPEPPAPPTPAAAGAPAETAAEANGEEEPATEVETEPAVERSGPGVPVLGMIPAVAAWRGRERPVLRRDQPTSPAAEAYRGLASTIQHILPHRPLRSLVVTSPAKGDGRTTVVANLGVVLARSGRTVVVVDCDLRNPRLHYLYGLSNDAGFTSVLRGEAPLSRAVQQVPGEPRLQVLASGPTPPAPGQLLSAQRTVEVLTALQAQADVVVIDVPVTEAGSDAGVVASLTDAALVIAGAPSGQAGELARAVDFLDDIDGLVVGVVLNAVEDDDTDGRVALLRRDMPRVSLA
jgi:capsular exopolysaccharide synthesis family protein